tara:strand:+ start:1081 stop:1431 length:351 start_codon:yes stop_codon:yes gene_type:complete
MKGIFGLFAAFTLSFSVFAGNCEEPVSKDRFDGFYNNTEVQKNDQQRYQLILAFSSRECISVAQMTKLLTLITDHKIKFSVVKDTYKLLFDKDQRVLLLNDFSEHEQMLINKEVSK